MSFVPRLTMPCGGDNKTLRSNFKSVMLVHKPSCGGRTEIRQDIACIAVSDGSSSCIMHGIVVALLACKSKTLDLRASAYLFKYDIIKAGDLEAMSEGGK